MKQILLDFLFIALCVPVCFGMCAFFIALAFAAVIRLFW